MRLLVGLFCATAIASAQSPMAKNYSSSNAFACHNGAENNRAPPRCLESSARHKAIMDSFLGVMRVQGAKLSGPERRAIAEYVTGKTISGDSHRRGLRSLPHSPVHHDRIGSTVERLGSRHYQTPTRSRQAAALTAADVPGNSNSNGRSDSGRDHRLRRKPSIAGGRVFVGSHNGSVFSLDAKNRVYLLGVQRERRRPHRYVDRPA